MVTRSQEIRTNQDHQKILVYLEGLLVIPGLLENQGFLKVCLAAQQALLAQLHFVSSP
jgi:hypothetical protein